MSGVRPLIALPWLLAAGLLAACAAAPEEAGRDGFEAVRTLASPDARQGVAADAGHLYAIANRSIAKLDRKTGAQVARWEAPADAPIVHLNSGIVLDGRLYCAHSNYPAYPMRSSIEIFDAATLAPLGRHDFGESDGSATWVDRRDGRWWVAFAHYAGRGGAPGKGPADTRLVAFDAQWRPLARYAFPPEVVARFADRSNSGGAFGPDGRLFATGHDAAELYVLRVPERGAQLELLAILPAPIEGQGIAFDPAQPTTIWGLVKNRRALVEMRR